LGFAVQMRTATTTSVGRPALSDACDGITDSAEIAARLRARGYSVDINSEVELFLIVSGEGLEKRPISRLGAALLSEGLVTLRQLAGVLPAGLS
jgi:hypothetical protein